jgi:catechol 2,3-dioxygenase-like lactoylglutathione lyase family enzyme
MIDHVSIGTRDTTRSIPFYKRCLGALGYDVQHEDATQTIWGKDGAWRFALYPADEGGQVVGNRAHVAFSAPSAAALQAFHEEAVALGAQSLRAPGPRPDINPQYFGAMFKDLDGHVIEAVYWRPSV